MLRKYVIAILTLISINSFAQDDTTGIDLGELSLEELMDLEVFVASRKYQKIIDVPATVTIVTQKDIRNWGANTLMDVLKHLPGIYVSMGSDGHYNLAIRGSQKEGNILFMINNRSINDFYTGDAVFDINPEIIERIEIVKAPGSALYGTNAMAGVINVITIHENSLSASVGLNNLVTLTGAGHLSKEKLEVSGLVSFANNTRNGATIEQDNAFNEPWSLTNDDKVYTSKMKNMDLIANLEVDYGNLSIDFFNFYRSSNAYVGPLHIASDGSSIQENRLLGTISYDYRIQNNVIVTPKVYYTQYNTNNIWNEYPTGYVSVFSNDTFTDGKILKESYLGTNYGASMDIFIKASDHLEILTGSVFEDYALQNYSATRNYSLLTDEYIGTLGNHDNVNYDQLGRRRYVFAYFLQANYNYKKLHLTTGLRYDDYNDFGQSFNPRIGLKYNFTPRLRLKGMFTKAFRAPTIKELYDNTNVGNEIGVNGNLNLRPERIQNIELGLEYNLEKLYLKYNAFYIYNKDLIRIYDPHGGGSVGEYRNVGNAKYFGHEAELIYKIVRYLNFRANYTHFMNRFYWNKGDVNESSVLFLDGNESFERELRHIPTLMLNAGMQFEIKDFKAMVSANFGNPSENNNRFYLEKAHFARIPHYVQLNANVQYAPSNSIVLTLMANNIGKKYSAPDASTNIDAYGTLGLIQPNPVYSFKVYYKF